MHTAGKIDIAYAAGYEHFKNFGFRDAPLSGENSGESIPELSDKYNIDLTDQDISAQFEDGYWHAVHDEAERQEA